MWTIYCKCFDWHNGLLSPSKINLFSCHQLDKMSFYLCIEYTRYMELYQYVLLCMFYAVTYMNKAGRFTKVLFFNMLHVAWFNHTLHKIGKKICGLFQTYRFWFPILRIYFFKSLNRIQLFKEAAPQLPTLTTTASIN